MTDTHQQVPNASQQEALIRVLSAPRLGTYLTAAGYDWNRAWALYMWNAKIGEAFYIPIQTVEVCLRNRLCAVLSEKYGSEWGTEDNFNELLDDHGKADLATVKQRIRNRNLPLVNGQIVAGLSFGFWISLLQRRYNPQLWSSSLKIAFPHLPEGRGRKTVAARFAKIAELRNRISHHEPIIRRNFSEEFREIMEAIDWMCPHTGGLIRPHCRIGTVMREKP
ncbi:MAG: Abi family protein [Hyphomicrobiaceae bacterium]|nr:Abi family protein [Hyphomicrobiaceae bacterium]